MVSLVLLNRLLTILSFHSFFLPCGLLLMLLIHPFISFICSSNCLSIHLIVYFSHTHSPSPFSKLGKHWGDNRAVSGLCCPLVALWFDVMIGWPSNIPKVQSALLLTTEHSVLAGTGIGVPSVAALALVYSLNTGHSVLTGTGTGIPSLAALS